MVELKDLLQDEEVIVNFHLHNEYLMRSCIAPKNCTDIHAALEMTLHRIFETGGTSEDACKIMGAIIPTEEQVLELEEYDEFIWLDLGYVLPGLIDHWEPTDS